MSAGKGNLIRESETRNLIPREPNSPSPRQGDQTGLGWQDISYVGRITPMQAQIRFCASPVCHELGSLRHKLRSELLSCKLRTVCNASSVPQPTVPIDYQRHNHERPTSGARQRIQISTVRQPNSLWSLRASIATNQRRCMMPTMPTDSMDTALPI